MSRDKNLKTAKVDAKEKKHEKALRKMEEKQAKKRKS